MPDNDLPKTVIKVEHLTKTFKVPIEAHSGIKQKIINYLKGRKGYREFTPLDDVSFEIKEGEFFGIVGRNGSGKSTLLKSIAGIYLPGRGAVHVDGVLIPFIELGVGFNPELTGRENVYLNGALLGFSRNEVEAMYDEIVEFAELHDFMEERLKNYSSGMQVRLAFSIAIRAQGDILLLDEVLAVGDSAFQQKCFDYFEKLKLEKKTIVLVTHSMDAVKRFCTKALLLENGAIKIIGNPEDIADQYMLDNIQSIEKHDPVEPPSNSKVEQLSADINKKEFLRSEQLEVSYKYILKESVDIMLGLVILKDGISVAEINSRSIELGGDAGTLYTATVSTPLKTLNPGEYSINVSLMDRKSRAILGYELSVSRFVIKGNDQSRGAAAYLDGVWRS